MKSPYAADKALWHVDRMQMLREGKQPPPVHVQIILCDLCDMRCSFCSYRMEGYTSNQLFATLKADGTRNNNPNRMIPTEKVKEILDDCAAMGVKAIQFTGGGEPTVHPDHRELFKHALDLGLEISLVTHGGNLTESTMQLLTRATWVRVSVDAGKAETYSSVRGVSERRYHQAIDNIRHLCRCRDSAGSRLTVGVGFVVTRDNWQEVRRAAEIAKDCGANNFRISAIFQPDGDAYFDGFRISAADLCKYAEELSDERFRVVNNFGDRVDDLHQGSPDYQFCGYQNFTTYIGGDLNVYRCCNTAYNARGLIGSIKSQRFAEFWNSQKKQKDFDIFDARGCERCQFNRQNRNILAQLEVPSHVNFV